MVNLDLNGVGVTLHPGEKYRYSVEAANTVGGSQSPDQIFTTKSALATAELQQSSTAGSQTQSPSLAALGQHKNRKHRRHRTKLHRARRER